MKIFASYVGTTLLFFMTVSCVLAQQQEEEKHLLQYSFQPDEKLRWEVTHLGITNTKIRGTQEQSETRSVATKLWEITEVDEEKGLFTLVHMVEKVSMRNKISGQEETLFDSQEDKEVPLQYRQVARGIGVPLATIVLNRQGQVVSRKAKIEQKLDLGLGHFTLPLPAERITAGTSWSSPHSIMVKETNGQSKEIKTRQRYKLLHVKNGLATIQIKTEVLTPVADPKIKSQLVQRLTDGQVVFDMLAGRVLSKTMDWDEDIVGFSGAESRLKYTAKYEEKLVK
ncbi:MAG: hypothetical protein MPJ24_00550 [Pirellulaceae bacterium]|nr:hypothetical protein [Pirellulaceae bacterium]